MMKAKFRNMPHPQVFSMPLPPPTKVVSEEEEEEKAHSEKDGDQHVQQGRETETKEHKSGDEEDEWDEVVVVPEQVCTDRCCLRHVRPCCLDPLRGRVSGNRRVRYILAFL